MIEKNTYYVNLTIPMDEEELLNIITSTIPRNEFSTFIAKLELNYADEDIAIEYINHFLKAKEELLSAGVIEESFKPKKLI